MDNYDLNEGAERAESYLGLLIGLFKKLDADPVEALTSSIMFVAVCGRSLDASREKLEEVISDALDDVYSIEVPKED